MFPLVSTTVVGVAVVLLIRNTLVSEDTVTSALTMRALMNLLWPLTVMNLLSKDDQTNVAVVPSLAWMSAVWWLDSYSLVHGGHDQEAKNMGLRLDTHTITALSFGLCSLVGARSDTQYVHFILYAILLCIMFVLPYHNLPDTDPMHSTIDELQRMCIKYSIALIITGVVFTRSTTLRSS